MVFYNQVNNNQDLDATLELNVTDESLATTADISFEPMDIGDIEMAVPDPPLEAEEPMDIPEPIGDAEIVAEIFDGEMVILGLIYNDNNEDFLNVCSVRKPEVVSA